VYGRAVFHERGEGQRPVLHRATHGVILILRARTHQWRTEV
jgi:hypothetical protein